MENSTQTTSVKKKIKLDFKDSKYATGRRKRSIAKVWVKKGSGNIYVNGIKMNDYFKRPVHQLIVNRPLEISNVANLYDVRCSVTGGGLSGQAGAIIHGLSRALVLHDTNLKPELKKDKLMTRDSRVVERKKYGHKKARRSFQFSKR
jgi:small subunit ribosomal protein S9